MRTKFLAVLIAIAGAALMTGCAYGPFATPAGGTWPAFVYTDGQVYPSLNTSGTEYQLTTDDFEIRGTVVATGEAMNILGIFAEGDNGYASLMEEARAQGCDDVMNVRVDTRHTNILSLYVKDEVILTGQGVRWTR